VGAPEETVPLELPGYREEERSRRAQKPANPTRKRDGLTYDSILQRKNSDGTLTRPKPAEPMPPTSCQSVEPAPKNTDKFSGPYYVHESAVHWFETTSGFGFWRMGGITNKRGQFLGATVIDRVELVSLLTDYVPSAYVLDEMATPTLTRQAKRRHLDKFEQLGLEAVRRGEDLVWTPEAPTRMFGALRANDRCLECHTNAKEGDLLGAFTYYLEMPVDQLGVKRGSNQPVRNLLDEEVK
jgi:hypothetical protein